MALGRDAMRHAGGIYRKVLPRLRHPAREIAAEVEHLREARALVAILGIVLFLLPVVLLILGLAFAAYYLAG
jgi:hypothetical protein